MDFEGNLTLPSFRPATAAATTAGDGLVVAVVAVVQVAVVAVAAVAPACPKPSTLESRAL